MKKNRKERIAKLMDHVRLLAEDALGLFEDSGSSDGDLEHDLHQVMNLGEAIAGQLRGEIREKTFGSK